MDDLERCRKKFLEDIFSKKPIKNRAFPADVRDDGLLSDPMRRKDFLDGLPIPCGDDLLVNPF